MQYTYETENYETENCKIGPGTIFCTDLHDLVLFACGNGAPTSGKHFYASYLCLSYYQVTSCDIGCRPHTFVMQAVQGVLPVKKLTGTRN